jgi:hypothetical protein
MSDLTFIVPVAEYHYNLEQRAVESVRAQTIPCELYTIHDTGARGAGWARNRGLESVKTKYAAFLDADDTLDPRFAEICLGILDHYAESGKTDPRYVYTDWLGIENVAHKAPEPCNAWTDQTSHLVTTVLPTDRVRLIGGFDETMQIEDADFYVRLRLSGVCGIHVNAPLVHYREGGQRSIIARATGAELAAQSYMTNRYGGMNFMGCCGDTTQGPTGPTNDPLEGDVLAQAQWQGNRVERGRVTGRMYPRTSFPKTVYVARQDVEAAPMHWKRVNSPSQASSGVILQPQYQASDNWQSAVDLAFGGGQQPAAPSQPIEYRPNVAGRSKKDVLAKAQE